MTASKCVCVKATASIALSISLSCAHRQPVCVHESCALFLLSSLCSSGTSHQPREDNFFHLEMQIYNASGGRVKTRTARYQYVRLRVPYSAPSLVFSIRIVRTSTEFLFIIPSNPSTLSSFTPMNNLL